MMAQCVTCILRKNVLVESSVEQYDNEKYQSGAAPQPK